MIEVTRQALTCIKGFEPYSAFQRLVDEIHNPMAITSGSIDTFMREISSSVDCSSAEVLINMFSSRLTGMMDFEDFLRLVLAREATSGRFEAAKRAVPENVEVSPEVEYLLSKLIGKMCEFFRKIRTDSEIQTLLSDSSSLFGMIGGRNLDYNCLSSFFKTLNLNVNEKDILAILRVIDINNDGVIDRSEFDYFLSLLNVRLGSSGIRENYMNKIKTKVRNDLVQVTEVSPIERKPIQIRDELRQSVDTRPPARTYGERVSDITVRDSRGTGGIAERYKKTEITYEAALNPRARQNDRSKSRSVSQSASRLGRERRTDKTEVLRGETRPLRTAEILRTRVRETQLTYTPQETKKTDTFERDNATNFRNFSVLKPLEPETIDRRDPIHEPRKHEAYSYKRSLVNEKPSNQRAQIPSRSSVGGEEKKSTFEASGRSQRDRQPSSYVVPLQHVDETRFGARDLGDTGESYKVFRETHVFSSRFNNTGGVKDQKSGEY